jgi:spore coat protein U-like protein
MKKFILATLGVALVGTSLNANALGTATGAVPVTLVLTSGCTLDTTSLNLDFGVLLITAPATTLPAGDITVACAPGVSYRVGVNAGLAATGTTRNLVFGANPPVPYSLNIGAVQLGDAGLNGFNANVYTETTAPWATATAAVTSTGTVDTIGPITAIITPPVGAVAGTYTDTVTVTVAW